MEESQYRAGIGAVIINSKKQILMFSRRGDGSWQLPEGGLDRGKYHKGPVSRNKGRDGHR